VQRKYTGFLLSVIALMAMSTAAVRPAVAQPASQVVALWHNATGPAQNAINWLVGQYQASHPNTQVVARYIEGDLQAAYLNAFRAQRGPDIILGSSSWTGSLADLNAIISIDARLNSDLTAQAYPAAWQTTSYHGQSYGIPSSAECVGLYYNTSLISHLPTTFDALLTQVQGKTPSGLTMAYDFYTTAGLYFGLGGRLIDDKDQPLLDSTVILPRYLGLLQKSYVAAPLTPQVPGGIPVWSDSSFRLGQSAYLIDGSWKLADLNRYLSWYLRVAPLPDVGAGHPWQPLLGTKSFFLSANSDHLDAAFDFASYALDRASQTVIAALGEQPPVNLAARVDDSRLAALTKQCAVGQAMPPSPKMSTYWRVLDQSAFAVTVNSQNADKTAIDAVKQISAASVTGTPQP
jgi:maltose-binding protein MalE